jgi:hypothetical protein
MLNASLLACAQRIGKLRQSVGKTHGLFPLTIARAQALTDDEEESIDALILRYSQCVSMIQDQIFRGIAFLEQEDIGDKSNRDKALLMEKLGAIQSATEFGTAALLSNKFAHHYPDQSQARVDRLSLVISESEFVVTAFESIEAYLLRKGFAP